MEEKFNPIDFGFVWTKDWYEFDHAAAHKAAKVARNIRVKELKVQGYQPRKFSNSNQLITCGGIGSGHPQIENVVTVYRLAY